jgi:triphosphoribosyl-dephospho-CoA synthetase
MLVVKIDSSEPGLAFSVFSGKDERLGFRVKEWSDTVYSSGIYSIVLVMSRERAALDRRFQYEAVIRKRINDEERRQSKAMLRNLEVLGRGGTQTEKLLNAQADETAAREFSQGMELLKLNQQIAELEARQKETIERIPYSLLVKVK